MRPLKLMMQAFGPYAKKEIIDFSELENRTMFVISGKTGAGKTTIFDGISFAIYGKASGEDRNGAELRSQFAPEDFVTEVSLEFALRNKKYYIWRTPLQEKKKARGEGFTTIGAKAELYVLKEDGTREIIASNIREVEEKIKEIIQLDANQFRQILMIPQGEFRKLLVSDSKDKEAILQRLFHTQLYKRIEDHLKEEATVLKRQVEGKAAERTHILKGLSILFDEELKLALEEENLNDSWILARLENEIDEIKNKLEEERILYEQKKIERDNAKKRLDEADSIVKQIELKEQLRKQKEILIEQRDQIEGKKSEIDNAHKAARLEQQDMLCHRLRKDYDGNLDALKKAEGKVLLAKKELDSALALLQKEEERASDREQIVKELHTLNNVKEDVYSFAEKELELKRLEQLQMHLAGQVELEKTTLFKLEETFESNNRELEKLETVHKEFYETERMLHHHQKTLEMLEKLRDWSTRKSRLEQSMSERNSEYQNALSRLADARETLTKMEQSWQMGQASLIAQILDEGEPCPVCGSIHHPNPAVSLNDIPNESDLKAARLDAEMLEKEKANSESRWLESKSVYSAAETSLEEQITELRTYLPAFSVEKLEESLSDVQQSNLKNEKQLASLKEKMAYQEMLSSENKKAADTLKGARVKLEQLQERERTHIREFIEKKSSVQHLVNSLPIDLRSRSSFDQKLNNLQTRKQAMEASYEEARKQVQNSKEHLSASEASLKQLKEMAKKAEQVLKEEREAFVVLLEEQGFGNYQAFAGAKRTSEQVKLLEQAVQQFGEEYRSVSDRLTDITDRLQGVEMPDLQALTNAFHEMEKELVKIADKQTSFLLQQRQNADIRDKVVIINEEIKTAEEKYKTIGHLSDMAKGQNTYRITFERYVLASFLDDILTAANGRLIKMTGGRYQLLRKTDRSKGNSQSGLELLVFDQYTGQERHVKTLSGGESFKAALSLALGLADIVQQYAGGVSLETMFIDEGFGTLDPESLDHAIEALMEIQSSGRLVGIISHVPELKERIDARLEVTATQSGSCTSFEFLG
ncbi:AAA family ATPase [Heyndrickxia acidicola]|uniref:Nuclease SbcCD subunit C n=1 Tax=Heyndrickxia acidicola TaxID=209389 RepID=A0ABU6MDX9_9BACI|nr:SMC family ATPase [Heyndrickxia acidicola]MED1201883.1 SMC family ATPase [Heyndrickxia acidicola]